MDDSKIRVVIVDDHPGVRAGIRRLLGAADDIHVVGEGSDGKEAVHLAQTYAPEIMLLDVEMPVIRGEEALRQIRYLCPEVKVLAVSSYHDRTKIQGMLEHGSNGYITKDEAPELLLTAIRELAKGVPLWISPLVQQSLRLTKTEELTLTHREVEILRGLNNNRSLVQISEELGIEIALLKKFLRLLKVKFRVYSLKSLVCSTRHMFDSPK